MKKIISALLVTLILAGVNSREQNTGIPGHNSCKTEVAGAGNAASSGGKISFLCGTSNVTDFSGNTYNTVQIGNHCWLRENLNIGTFVTSGNTQANNSLIEKYCYNDMESNCNIYGGLYLWDEMMHYHALPGNQGICPPGWRIPSDADWCTLTSGLDSTINCNLIGLTGTNAGGLLKETGTGHWYTPNTGATNSSGFTGLPGGYFTFTDSTFNNTGCLGIFHTSTSNGTGRWAWQLGSGEARISRASYIPGAFSVRCLYDANWTPQLSVTPSVKQVTAEAGTLTFSVSSNLEWSVEVSEEWLTVTPASGYLHDTVTVNYDAYGTASSRTGQITLTASGGTPTVIVTITQMGQFTCGQPYTDARDGKIYNTLQLGTQCWMQQNLNTGTRINGSVSQANNGIIEKYCYNDAEANCDLYGAMYQWNEVMQYTTAPGAQGVCMAGWHLPTWEEYGLLINYMGAQPSYRCDYNYYYHAKALASESLWNASTTLCAVGNNPAANNLTDFSGLPGGKRQSSTFKEMGNEGDWYTSTLYYNMPYAFTLSYNNSMTYGVIGLKTSSYSVRCLHNQNVALQLNVDPMHRDVGAAAGNTSVGVTSNTGWKVEESSEWITVNPLTGLNNGAITVSYDENPSAEPRTAQFSVKTYDGSVSVNVTVTQAGGEGTILVVTPAVQQVSAEAGIAGFQVFSNSGWQVYENTDWFAVNPVIGELNDTLSITYDENTTSVVRSGGISVTAADGSKTVLVTLIQSRLPACGQPISDPRNGKTYSTIQIGNQCWMQQNLNLGTRVDHTQNQTNDSIFEKYCFQNLESNCDLYGGLYQWDEAMQYSELPASQGICMPGWHLPSDNEWFVLSQYISGRPEFYCDGIDAWTAKALASPFGWTASSTTCTPGNNQAANNSTGFTMMPGGYKYSNGFTNPGEYSAYWSSSPADSQNAMWWLLEYSKKYLGHSTFQKTFGVSVRCLRDE